MSGVNKVILVGRLGQDPKVRYFENKSCVAEISLATSETYTDKDNNKIEQTEWHKVVFWNNIAQVAEKYLHKGDMVYVEGKLRTKNYEDKDKIKRYVTEVYANTLTMLSSKGVENGNKAGITPNNSTQTTTTTPVAEVLEEQASVQPVDSLPF